MKKSGSGTTPIHDYPLTYAIVIISVLTRRVTLTFSDGKPLPSLSYNCTIQSVSVSSVAQKKYLRFMDATNTRLPVCCSITTCASDPIRFAKRFFAFFEIGFTVASSMISMCFVCVKSSRDVCLVEMLCATCATVTWSRRDYSLD